jgi:hypothetical protein
VRAAGGWWCVVHGVSFLFFSQNRKPKTPLGVAPLPLRLWQLKLTDSHPRPFCFVHLVRVVIPIEQSARVLLLPDGAPKQARWTPIVSIAQNRFSVRLHCRIAHNYPLLLLLLTAARRPLLVIPPRRPVACGRGILRLAPENSVRCGHTSYLIRTSHRPTEGLHAACSPVRGPAWGRGPRAAGCFAWSILRVASALYDRGLVCLTCACAGWDFLYSPYR